MIFVSEFNSEEISSLLGHLTFSSCLLTIVSSVFGRSGQEANHDGEDEGEDEDVSDDDDSADDEDDEDDDESKDQAHGWNY